MRRKKEIKEALKQIAALDDECPEKARHQEGRLCFEPGHAQNNKWRAVLLWVLGNHPAPWGGGDDPNPLATPGETYTRWDISRLGAGLAHVRYETNDDNDDGVPDPGLTVWEQNLTLKTDLELCGHKSHTGAYGQPVDVYIDGEKLLTFSSGE